MVEQRGQRIKRLQAYKRIGREVSVGCARGAIEHPCRNLQPPLDLRAVQSAAQGYAGSLFDHLVNKDVAPAPRMKPIQNVPANGPVGVPKPPCTTQDGLMQPLTAIPPDQAYFDPLPLRTAA